MVTPDATSTQYRCHAILRTCRTCVALLHWGKHGCLCPLNRDLTNFHLFQALSTNRMPTGVIDTCGMLPVLLGYLKRGSSCAFFLSEACAYRALLKRCARLEAVARPHRHCAASGAPGYRAGASDAARSDSLNMEAPLEHQLTGTGTRSRISPGRRLSLSFLRSCGLAASDDGLRDRTSSQRRLHPLIIPKPCTRQSRCTTGLMWKSIIKCTH